MFRLLVLTGEQGHDNPSETGSRVKRFRREYHGANAEKLESFSDLSETARSERCLECLQDLSRRKSPEEIWSQRQAKQGRRRKLRSAFDEAAYRTYMSASRPLSPRISDTQLKLPKTTPLAHITNILKAPIRTFQPNSLNILFIAICLAGSPQNNLEICGFKMGNMVAAELVYTVRRGSL